MFFALCCTKQVKGLLKVMACRILVILFLATTCSKPAHRILRVVVVLLLLLLLLLGDFCRADYFSGWSGCYMNLGLVKCKTQIVSKQSEFCRVSKFKLLFIICFIVHKLQFVLIFMLCF